MVKFFIKLDREDRSRESAESGRNKIPVVLNVACDDETAESNDYQGEDVCLQRLTFSSAPYVKNPKNIADDGGNENEKRLE